MNVDCDSAVKAYLHELAYSDLTMAVPSTIHQEGWTCWINGIKMTTDHSEPVHVAVSSKVIKKCLDYKSHLNEEAFDRVDWDTVRCAMKNFPPLFRMWVTKHVSGHCRVGWQMKLCSKWDSDKCPCCEEVEWAPHVVVCPDPDQGEVWREVVAGLAEWCVATKTNLAIMDCICDTLTLHSTEAKFVEFAEGPIVSAVEEQDEIGWMNFIEGWISKKWKEAQHQYYLIKAPS